MEAVSREFLDMCTWTNSELKAALVDMLLKYSILRGDFTLKSGKKSTWFIDVKATACIPKGMTLIGLLTLRMTPEGATAIGGQTMGSDPIAFSTAAFGAVLGRDLRSFSIRKEVKDHGGGGKVAGALSESDNVVVVEDASSRGTSMLAAIEAARVIGATVISGVSVVDRGGTVGHLLNSHGVEFSPILTAPELGLAYEGGLE